METGSPDLQTMRPSLSTRLGSVLFFAKGFWLPTCSASKRIHCASTARPVLHLNSWACGRCVLSLLASGPRSLQDVSFGLLLSMLLSHLSHESLRQVACDFFAMSAGGSVLVIPRPFASDHIDVRP